MGVDLSGGSTGASHKSLHHPSLYLYPLDIFYFLLYIPWALPTTFLHYTLYRIPPPLIPWALPPTSLHYIPRIVLCISLLHEISAMIFAITPTVYRTSDVLLGRVETDLKTDNGDVLQLLSCRRLAKA
ncbi:hypothetical protein B0H15DRAFT_814899 [Mycena belliarum]|uniref:Uncharacterized protein n=1 Tax=Mycena belliarum TaxID=1033014 RepID=A0AAD6UGJ8_9AGAR|nr:hypothetical protein B0H15DRAFT_814899 [Mycena belliae]